MQLAKPAELNNLTIVINYLVLEIVSQNQMLNLIISIESYESMHSACQLSVCPPFPFYFPTPIHAIESKLVIGVRVLLLPLYSMLLLSRLLASHRVETTIAWI